MSISLGAIFAVLAMVFWGLEELFLKQAIGGLKSITTFSINTIAGALLSILIIFFFFDGAISPISYPDFFVVALTAVVAFAGYIFFYLALEKQEVSLVASIEESWVIIAAIIAVVAFGERISTIHILSILAVLAGAFLISVDMSSLSDLKLISGSGYIGWAVLFTGITVPLEKIVVTRVGEANSIFYLYLLYFPLILVAKKLLREKFLRPTRKLLIFSTLSGLADGAAFAFYLVAIKLTDVSIVAPIVASSVVVVAFLARHYLQERMSVKEIFGAALILLGVMVLSVRFNF